MAVTHMSGVLGFERVMAQGGTHLFEVTADEVPELEEMGVLDEGVEILCTISKSVGVWAGIINEIATKNGSCVYKRIRNGVYLVTVTIPSP